jgi:hypothetical protein
MTTLKVGHNILRCAIRDPVPFCLGDRGWVKSQDQPRSYFRELRNHFFGVKILKFFDADPGSVMKKFRSGIRHGKISDPVDPQH